MIDKYYKIKVCKKYNKDDKLNECKYGDKCKYAHGIEDLRCKFYQDGNCEKKEKCSFIHQNYKECINVNQNILNADENNNYNIKEPKNTIELNINVEDLKKQNNDWADDHTINTNLSKNDNKKIENESVFDKCINKLEEYKNYIYIKDEKLELIPNIDIILEKLYIDLDNSKKSLEMLLERYQ